MVAQTSRIRKIQTTAQRKASVEEMLRELAYILHVTRKVSQDLQWPIAERKRKVPLQVNRDAPTAAV